MYTIQVQSCSSSHFYIFYFLSCQLSCDVCIFKPLVNYIEKMQLVSFCLPCYIVVSEQDEESQLQERIYLVILGKKCYFSFSSLLLFSSFAMKVWWCGRGGLRSVPLVTAVLEFKRQQPHLGKAVQV